MIYFDESDPVRDLCRAPIHQAGPLELGVQRCTRCRLVLADFTRAHRVNGERPPLPWREGAGVLVSDRADARYAFHTEFPPTCLRP